MAGPTTLVSLADAKAHLNIAGTSDDTELQAVIDGAQAAVEDVVGWVVQRTLVEWHDGGQPTLLLRHTPIVSVTSVVEYIGHTGIALTEQPLTNPTGDGYGYTVEAPAGILTRRGVMLTSPPSVNPWVVGNPVPFYPGVRNVQVTYVAGRDSVPANVTQGALEVIRHAWETQRYPEVAPSVDDGGMIPTRSGYLIPYRAMQWLSPSRWRTAGKRIG